MPVSTNKSKKRRLIKTKIKTKKTATSKTDLKREVNKILAEVRPALQMDGGDVELESIKNGVVTLNIKGACHGCPMATITFGQGVAGLIKKRLPQIKEVRYW
jgi:Fe-S cluster biogenesis protein NfuA